MEGIFGKKPASNHRLIQVRKGRNLSRKEVAARINVHWGTYYKWERGQQSPGLRHLRLLCDLFQATPEELGYNLDDIGR
jgi:DNA-binding XRE family transcriptional regulator